MIADMHIFFDEVAPVIALLALVGRHPQLRRELRLRCPRVVALVLQEPVPDEFVLAVLKKEREYRRWVRSGQRRVRRQLRSESIWGPQS